MAIVGEDELAADNRLVYSRGQKILNYLTQPFFSAEVQTGRKGVFVHRADTVRDIRQIIDGTHDDRPAATMLYIGTLDQK